MEVVTLTGPIYPVLAMTNPLCVVASIGAVFLAANTYILASKVESLRYTKILCLSALPLIVVNPLIAYLMQGLIFGILLIHIYLLPVQKSSLLLEGALTISYCKTSEMVQAQMDTLSVTELQRIKVVKLDTCPEIPENLFERCPNLQEVIIRGESRQDIPAGLLRSCRNLQKFDCSVNLCNGWEISPDFFRDCPSLQEVVLTDLAEIETIPGDLFSGCPNLQKVILQDFINLLTIPANLFRGCHELQEVDFSGPPISVSSFTHITGLPENFFQDCSKLKKVYFERWWNLRTLRENLFQSCHELQEVSFADSRMLRGIPKNLFKDCQQLQRVDLNRCVLIASLPPLLFQGCHELLEVSCQRLHNLISIPIDFFSNCPNLQKIDFQLCEKLEIIPEDLLAHCLKIQTALFAVGYKGPLPFLPASLAKQNPSIISSCDVPQQGDRVASLQTLAARVCCARWLSLLESSSTPPDRFRYIVSKLNKEMKNGKLAFSVAQAAMNELDIKVRVGSILPIRDNGRILTRPT